MFGVKRAVRFSLLLLVATPSACIATSDAPRSGISSILERSFEERLLARMPLGKVMYGHPNLLFSPDGRRAAYVIREGLPDDPLAKNTIVVGDGPGLTYGWIGALRLVDFQGRPVFSPDGVRLAFAARTALGDSEKWCVVVDGKRGEEFEEVEDPIFSPDGASIAYRARERGKDLIVLNGRRIGTEYDRASRPVFSPDGRRFAYSARHGAVRDEEGSWTGGKACIVIGEEKGEDFDSVFAPVFNRDGTVVAYGAVRGGRQLIVVNGRPGETFDFVSAPAISPDGKRVAHGAAKGEKWFLVVNGKKAGPEFDWVGEPFFSPDGSAVAYQAVREALKRDSFGFVEGKRCVVLENVPGEDGDFLWEVRFGADGRQLTYTLNQGDRWFAVVGRKKLGAEFESSGDPVVSADGKSTAFIASVGEKSFVVAGDRKGPLCDHIEGLVFSPDGKQLGYGARLGDELWRKVMDVR